MSKLEQQSHWIFLYWLVFFGFTVFLTAVALHEGYVEEIFTSDRSKIVFLIAALYIFGTLMAGRRAKFLSQEIDHFRSATADTDEALVEGNDALDPHFLELLKTSKLFQNDRSYRVFEQEEGSTSYMFYLLERCRGPHDLNWFISESILKLGLLGTIIGFILMLGPVIEITTFDVGSMQQILSKMSAGMGTALYTTLAGIVGSTTLSFQNLILDKGSDSLINEIILKKNGVIASAKY